MGEFKEVSMWTKLALLTIAIGFILDLCGFATGVLDGYNDVRACMVIGFLCFLVALLLALSLVFLDEVRGSKAVLICIIIFAFVAGLITIIGVALWGTNVNRNCVNGICTGTGVTLGTYSAMELICGALLAILSGIFAVLEIAGVRRRK